MITAKMHTAVKVGAAKMCRCGYANAYDPSVLSALLSEELPSQIKDKAKFEYQ